jgi:hypothetical protein
MGIIQKNPHSIFDVLSEQYFINRMFIFWSALTVMDCRYQSLHRFKEKNDLPAFAL